MFFPSGIHAPKSGVLRRPTLSAQQIQVVEPRATVELPTSIASRRRSRQISIVAIGQGEELRQPSYDEEANNNNVYQADLTISSPIDDISFREEARRASRQFITGIKGTTIVTTAPLGRTTVVLRRPTITIGEDGKILIDHVSARWDGLPLPQAGLLDMDDGATIITDTLKEDAEEQETMGCAQKTIKYTKILLPHVFLVSVLIGYLCIGAWTLMTLETRAELMSRSRKLIRLTNLVRNLTADSWNPVNDAQTGIRQLSYDEWADIFREYLVRVAEFVDDRRPIRRELNDPERLDNMHNKWTFPTALLYVLTVLTTCGYGEVSVERGRRARIDFSPQYRLCRLANRGDSYTHANNLELSLKEQLETAILECLSRPIFYPHFCRNLFPETKCCSW